MACRTQYITVSKVSHKLTEVQLVVVNNMARRYPPTPTFLPGIRGNGTSSMPYHVEDFDFACVPGGPTCPIEVADDGRANHPTPCSLKRARNENSTDLNSRASV